MIAIKRLTTGSIGRGYLHGVGWYMGSIVAPLSAGTGAGDTLLVASKLDEAAELLLGKTLQGLPEELNVCVCLHQTDLVHGVSLKAIKRKICIYVKF